MRFRWGRTLATVGLIALYVLLGNARGVQPNPAITGATIAVNMIVPVLAGMFLGMRAGGTVGFLGTAINAFSPAGGLFELAAIIPHTIMGMTAGYLHRRGAASPASALSILLGHILNIIAFLIAGLVNISSVVQATFWHALGVEAIYGALTALIVYKLINLIQAPVAQTRKRIRSVTLRVGVWKILAVIALLLTGIFVLFFSFPMISVTLVIGAALLMLAEKLRLDFERWAEEREISKSRKRAYGHVLWVFWTCVIILLATVTITSVSGAITDLGTRDADDYLEPVEGYLPAFVTKYLLTESSINRIESAIFKLFANVLGNATEFMLNAIIIIPLMFITYYKQRRDIAESFSQVIPEKIRSEVTEMVSRVTKQLKAFISAKLIESLIVGLICVVGFFVAGIEGFLLLGLLAGLLNIIPYVGPVLGAIPALLLATTQAPVAALIVLITVFVAQAIDNLYLQPFMISGQVQINPLLSVILTLLGAQALGVLGMLFAIPVYLVYKLVLGESHRILVAYAK